MEREYTGSNPGVQPREQDVPLTVSDPQLPGVNPLSGVISTETMSQGFSVHEAAAETLEKVPLLHVTWKSPTGEYPDWQPKLQEVPFNEANGQSPGENGYRGDGSAHCDGSYWQPPLGLEYCPKEQNNVRLLLGVGTCKGLHATAQLPPEGT